MERFYENGNLILDFDECLIHVFPITLINSGINYMRNDTVGFTDDPQLITKGSNGDNLKVSFQDYLNESYIDILETLLDDSKKENIRKATPEELQIFIEKIKANKLSQEDKDDILNEIKMVKDSMIDDTKKENFRKALRTLINLNNELNVNEGDIDDNINNITFTDDYDIDSQTDKKNSLIIKLNKINETINKTTTDIIPGSPSKKRIPQEEGYKSVFDVKINNIKQRIENLKNKEKQDNLIETYNYLSISLNVIRNKLKDNGINEFNRGDIVYKISKDSYITRFKNIQNLIYDIKQSDKGVVTISISDLDFFKKIKEVNPIIISSIIIPRSYDYDKNENKFIIKGYNQNDINIELFLTLYKYLVNIKVSKLNVSYKKDKDNIIITFTQIKEEEDPEKKRKEREEREKKRKELEEERNEKTYIYKGKPYTDTFNNQIFIDEKIKDIFPGARINKENLYTINKSKDHITFDMGTYGNKFYVYTDKNKGFIRIHGDPDEELDINFYNTRGIKTNNAKENIYTMQVRFIGGVIIPWCYKNLMKDNIKEFRISGKFLEIDTKNNTVGTDIIRNLLLNIEKKFKIKYRYNEYQNKDINIPEIIITFIEKGTNEEYFEKKVSEILPNFILHLKPELYKIKERETLLNEKVYIFKTNIYKHDYIKFDVGFNTKAFKILIEGESNENLVKFKEEDQYKIGVLFIGSIILPWCYNQYIESGAGTFEISGNFLQIKTKKIKVAEDIISHFNDSIKGTSIKVKNNKYPFSIEINNGNIILEYKYK
jgi:hypothetical protein